MTDDAGREADDGADAGEHTPGATDGGEEVATDPTADAERSGGDADAGEAAGDDTADADPSDESAETAAGDAGGESVPGPDVGADVPGADVPDDGPESGDSGARQAVPDDVAKYDRFQKMERAEYDRVNEFLRDRTYVTAREWAIARLCADFRTETGVEMTKIGENLPRLVPFMTDTYTPQAVNQARAAFEEKVRKAGATFLYGAMSGFFTAEDLDDVMYESTEVAKFLLEVEGADLAVEEELAAEDKISSVMRDVREASAEVRGEEVKCPECGHVHES